jgi:hypothetical protein
MGWKDGSPVDAPPAWMAGSAVAQIPTGAPIPGGAAPESVPQSTILGDLAAGSTNWQRRLRRGLVDTGESLGGPILKKALGFMNPSDEELAASQKAVNQGGTLADVTQMAGDMGASAFLPLAKGGMILQAAKNALYNNVTTPKEDKNLATGLGAAAPVLGKAIAATAGGITRNMVSPEAKLLEKEGVQMPIGMTLTGQDSPGFTAALLRNLESLGGYIPGVRETIGNKAAKSLEQMNVAEFNQALKPIGKSVDINLPPQQAHEKAVALADEAYNEAKRGIALNPNANIAEYALAPKRPGIEQPLEHNSNLADAFFDIAVNAQRNFPGLTEIDSKEIHSVYDQVIKARLENAKLNKGPIGGDVWKVVDSELDKRVRQNANKGDARHESLSEVYATMQKLWFDAAEDTIPGSKAAVRAADEAYSKLQPLDKVAERTPTGFWTPKARRNVDIRTNQEQTPFKQAIDTVTSGTPISSLRRYTGNAGADVGVGLTGAAALNGLIEGLAPGAGPGLGAVALAGGLLAGGTAGMESQAGQQFLRSGLHPVGQAATKRIQKILGKQQIPYDEQLINDIVANMTTQALRAKGAAVNTGE